MQGNLDWPEPFGAKLKLDQSDDLYVEGVRDGRNKNSDVARAFPVEVPSEEVWLEIRMLQHGLDTFFMTSFTLDGSWKYFESVGRDTPQALAKSSMELETKIFDVTPI